MMRKMPWSTNSMSRYDAGGPAVRRSQSGEDRNGTLAEAASNAPPGAFSPLHQSGHQSPLIFRVSGAGRKPEHR